MDQSQSSKTKDTSASQIALPKRSFTVEFLVGLFAMAGLASAAYLSVGLGGLEFNQSDNYYVSAEFDNISGLEMGASVEIAGIKVGEVVGLTLEDPIAVVKMKINKNVRLRDDDIAAIRTKGIIGDRYVKISRGASDEFIPPEGRMIETESVVDIEDIIGKIVHSFTQDKDDGE